MEQSGIQEILKALELHSVHVDKKIDQLKVDLETRMDNRFDKLEKRFDHQDKKFDGMRVELTETQETVEYLATKNVQHEKKLRTIYEQ